MTQFSFLAGISMTSQIICRLVGYVCTEWERSNRNSPTDYAEAFDVIFHKKLLKFEILICTFCLSRLEYFYADLFPGENCRHSALCHILNEMRQGSLLCSVLFPV